MADTAIRVENISKRYNILHKQKNDDDSLIRAFAGGIKGLLKSNGKQVTEDFWALRDVSFEISKGDRVGIIGRNGAGKSTLLKILSRIVKPSSGRIEYYGRMASLLEVGTGFHGELTGRENIYLNGSILGMSRAEIDSKFDEIVAFSEVEQFLDTPVKRYSSGMYVRLAFAVAAHLEPEILVIDEVLAVGDASFQKKSVGKMEEASRKEGKTILFVSHNMGQIAALCNKGILLNKGVVEKQGEVQPIIKDYFSNGADPEATDFFFKENKESKEYSITRVSLMSVSGEKKKNFAHDEPIVIEIEVRCNRTLNDVLLALNVFDLLDKRIFTSQIPVSDKLEKGKSRTFRVRIPDTVLTPNNYQFAIGLHIPNIQIVDEEKGAATFSVYDNGSEFFKYANVDIGTVFVKCEWEY
jgi:lipopolysaccharide transport system ATP-binding protein